MHSSTYLLGLDRLAGGGGAEDQELGDGRVAGRHLEVHRHLLVACLGAGLDLLRAGVGGKGSGCWGSQSRSRWVWRPSLPSPDSWSWTCLLSLPGQGYKGHRQAGHGFHPRSRALLIDTCSLHALSMGQRTPYLDRLALPPVLGLGPDRREAHFGLASCRDPNCTRTRTTSLFSFSSRDGRWFTTRSRRRTGYTHKEEKR